MAEPLRVVFLGSDAISLPLLEWLAGEGSVVAKVIAVYTQPDRPVGRGQKVVPNAIKTWALGRGLPVHQPEKLTDDLLASYASIGADAALVMAYGHILRDNFIAAPRLGTFNLHASILPRYRGASPIQTAVASGERETGVAFMRMVRRLDAGPVAAVEKVAIERHDTALDVEEKLARACVPLLQRTLPALAAGMLVFEEQDESAATFCRKLDKHDGAIDFAATAATIAARINGLFPWPACTVEVNGELLKLGLADALPQLGPAEAPGNVLGLDAEGLLIATGEGVLRVLRLQRAGGRMLNAPEFLRGYPIPAGTLMPSRAMPVLVSAAPFKKNV